MTQQTHQRFKALVVTPYFYPHPGGSQQYIEGLYTALQQQYPQVTVDVVCYNTDQKATQEKYQGLTIYRIPCWEILPGQFALPNYFALSSLLRQLKQRHGSYDMLNAHTRFFDTAWWGWIAARYLGATSVLTDHCAFHPNHPNAMVKIITKTLDYLLTPFLGRVYDQVTVVSQETQQFVKKLGIKESSVIYGGADTMLFKPQSKSGKKITIAFIGRLIPAKGAHLFKEALTRVLARYSQVEAIIVGDGPLKAKLLKDLPKHTQLLGALPHKVVAQILSQTEIMVHPSTHHEGLPLLLVEAGASGCSIVTTNQGGTKELIVDQKTGILVQPTVEDLAQKISYLIENPNLRQTLSKNIRTTVVKKFDWKISAKKFAALIGVR